VEASIEKVLPKSIIKVKINGSSCPMELYTGATLKSMSLATFRRICPSKTIEPTNIQMCGYFGEVKPALGKVNVHTQLGEVKSYQNLYIFEEYVDTVCG
jgi:hypothetical protein